jgi:hypothetical protein
MTAHELPGQTREENVALNHSPVERSLIIKAMTVYGSIRTLCWGSDVFGEREAPNPPTKTFRKCHIGKLKKRFVYPTSICLAAWQLISLSHALIAAHF